MIQVIVPVKSFRQAKTRLSAVVSGTMRVELARALACNLLSELRQSRLALHIAVISSEPGMARHCAEFGALYLEDDGAAGLNGALRAAEARLHCEGRTTAILCADLPLFRVAEFDRIASAHAARGGDQVTIVSDLAGEGTNLRLVSARGGLPHLYGPQSASAHLGAAQARGLAVQLLKSPAISLDIDTPGQARQVIQHAGARDPHIPEGASQICAILSQAISQEPQSWLN